MKKTFKQLINDIEEGELWENEEVKVFLKHDILKIETIRDDFVLVGLDDLFTAKRKAVNFNIAIEAYNRGKEIESNVSNYRYKLINGKDSCYMHGELFIYEGYSSPALEMNEIKGGWFINE